MWLSWSCFLYSQSVHVLDFSQHTDICSTKFWVVTYMGLGQEVWLVAWSLVTLSLWLHINKSPITELAWLKHHHVFLLASSLLTTITAHGERHLIFEVNKMVSCKRIVKFSGIKLKSGPRQTQHVQLQGCSSAQGPSTARTFLSSSLLVYRG